MLYQLGQGLYRTASHLDNGLPRQASLHPQAYTHAGDGGRISHAEGHTMRLSMGDEGLHAVAPK